MTQNADLPNPRVAGTAPTWPWPTSLNSGFRVFFRTLVLYLDLFPTFGCRKLVGKDRVSLGVAPERGSGEPPLPTCLSTRLHSQADKGVRVAVGIHGGEVGTAQHSHQQAAPPRAVAQGQQDASPLLPCCLHLLLQGWAVVSPVQPEPAHPPVCAPTGQLGLAAKKSGANNLMLGFCFPKQSLAWRPGRELPDTPYSPGPAKGKGLLRPWYWSVQCTFVRRGRALSGTNVLGAS